MPMKKYFCIRISHSHKSIKTIYQMKTMIKSPCFKIPFSRTKASKHKLWKQTKCQSLINKMNLRSPKIFFNQKWTSEDRTKPRILLLNKDLQTLIHLCLIFWHHNIYMISKNSMSFKKWTFRDWSQRITSIMTSSIVLRISSKKANKTTKQQTITYEANHFSEYSASCWLIKNQNNTFVNTAPRYTPSLLASSGMQITIVDKIRAYILYICFHTLKKMGSKFRSILWTRTLRTFLIFFLWLIELIDQKKLISKRQIFGGNSYKS
jgi:hypothetical protein